MRHLPPLNLDRVPFSALIVCFAAFVCVEAVGQTPAPGSRGTILIKNARVVDGLGSVSVGKSADLILVAGDPLEDMGALRHLSWVIKDGTAKRPEDWARGTAP